MTASSQPNEFGFKRLSLENWLTVDPVWDAFGKSEPSEWVHDLLKVNLDPVVPLAIRKLFETARGTLVYSLMFYPLLTIGTEQLFRVLEAAATNKCMAMNAPTKIKKFSDKLKWLLENHTIAQEQYVRWDATRQLRNSVSHLHDQNIFDPNIALAELDIAIALINKLFACPTRTD
jgi:hypothetical protein